jgi:predicted Zn-dependent peptidase
METIRVVDHDVKRGCSQAGLVFPARRKPQGVPAPPGEHEGNMLRLGTAIGLPPSALLSGRKHANFIHMWLFSTRLGLVAALLSLVGSPLAAQNLEEFEKAITEFTLDNGLHFIVLERHDAPVVSFQTHVDVGSVDDPKGRTGLAHMFEHMAFKGTPIVGTTDYEKERVALDRVNQAIEALEAERRKGQRADPQQIETLRKQVHEEVQKASELASSEEFSRLIEENGGSGLNAGTASDNTFYVMSLPSNRLELWFYLESERFLHPVFRDFYKERDVVREERRMRTESSPLGKLIEVFLGNAYLAHPYGWPGVGWASDIESLTVEDARQFFETYYVPANMTIAIVGDVDPDRVRALADAYFARLPKRPLPPPVETEEPPQEGQRRIEVISEAQPVTLVGYKKPSKYHPDRAVFDVISSVLAGGRTSWFYKELVRDRQIALQAGGFPDFPGDKYTSLFLFYAFPSSGHTTDENEQAMYELIERLKTQGPDRETLEMVKTKARAGLISGLDSNSGLASQLTSYHAGYGDWRQLFRWVDEINAVTPEDVQRVAKEYFVPENRTVGYLVKPRAAEEPPSKGGQ